MYLDKKLSGITAVQTLSRLDRRTEGKDKTYILDFVNDPALILQAFSTYYEDAHIETESDLDLVTKQVDKLDAAGIYSRADVEQFWDKWVAPGARQGSYDSLLAVPVDRFKRRWFNARDDEQIMGRVADAHTELETLTEFRSTLAQYVKSYAFFSQIFNLGDPYYEKLSAFADLLARRLRNFTLDEVAPEPLDVDDIVLTHYKLEKLKEEDNLRLVSAAETDFAYSKKARMGLSSKLWTYESETNELLDYVRKMPADKFMEFMLDMGLYERLRGEIDADTEGSGGAPHLTAL